MIDVRVLRAAGLSDSQIVDVIEAEQAAEAEKKAERREANRQAQIRCRERKRNKINGHVIDVTMTGMTSPPPSPPPSMVSPITPSLTTPTPPPSSHIRVVAKATPPDNPDFEKFWLAYPKRDGANPKAPARAKFERYVRSGVCSAALVDGARAYANAESANVGTPYIAQAVTWLNQRRWEDYKPVASTVGPEEAGRLIEQYHRRRMEAL